MAVPKKRHTKSKRNKRRMHIYLEEPALTTCLKCGKKIRPYTVCPHCGYYRGKKVVEILEKLTKRERKEREKEIKEREKEGKSLSLEELSRK